MNRTSTEAVSIHAVLAGSIFIFHSSLIWCGFSHREEAYLLMLVLRPPGPRRGRRLVGPEADLRRARFILQRIKAAIGDVPVENPRHAAPHLLRVRVDPAARDAPEHAAVLVAAGRLHHGVLSRAHVAQRLARALAEGLLAFRCVDFGQAHLDLLAVDEQGEGVAICDADHAPDKRLGPGRLGGEGEYE